MAQITDKNVALERQATKWGNGSAMFMAVWVGGTTAVLGFLLTETVVLSGPGLALLAVSGAVGAAASAAAGPIAYNLMGGNTKSDLEEVSAYLDEQAKLAAALGEENGSSKDFHVLITENQDGTYTVETVGLISNLDPVVISSCAADVLKQIFNNGDGGIKPKQLTNQPTKKSVKAL